MSFNINPVRTDLSDAQNLEIINNNFNNLNDNIEEQITKIDFLDIVKLVSTCNVATTAACESVYNALNIYESFVFEPLKTNATTGNLEPDYDARVNLFNWSIKYGDIICKGEEEAPQLISSPGRLISVPKRLSNDPTSLDYNVLTWEVQEYTSGMTVTLPTFNVKGDTGEAIYNNCVYRTATGFETITGLTVCPTLSFFTTTNQEVFADTSWYTISATGTTFSVTFDNTETGIPSIIEYIVIR